MSREDRSCHTFNTQSNGATARNKRPREDQEMQRGWKILRGKQTEKQDNEKELTKSNSKSKNQS